MSQTAPDRVDAAVSYSRADQDRVEPLLEGLKARGLAIWFDKDIPGGALWEEIIARKYRMSGALLFFVSRDSLASQRCSEEVSTARTLGKPIIPILLDPLKLPDDLPDRFVLTLQARNTVEAHNRPAPLVEEAIISALAGFGIAPGAPPPAAPAPQPRAAAPGPGAPAPRQDKRRSGAIIAFGGAALATVLVAAAYFLFMRPAPPAATAGAPAAASPVASASPAKPAPTPAPAADPAPPRPTPAAPAATPAPTDVAAATAVTLTLDKTAYVEGDEPVATVAGLPGNAEDWVAIALAGTPDNQSVSYVYTGGIKAGTLTLKPVMLAGRYEARVFLGKAAGGDKVQARVAFDVTPFPPPTLALDQETYLEGEAVTATVSGMLGAKEDWVAIAEEDAEPGVFVSYKYTGGGAGKTLRLKPVMQPGRYEARVFFNDASGDRTIRARAAFEVLPAPPVILTPQAGLYAPGEAIEVAFSGMPGNDNDWVAIAGLAADDAPFLDYVYTGGQRSGSVTLTAPEIPGVYELRAFFDDTTGDKTIRGSVTVEVLAEAPEPEPVPEPEPEPEPQDPAESVADPEPSPEAVDEAPPPEAAEPQDGAAIEPESAEEILSPLDCALPENVVAEPDQCPLDCANPAHAAAFPEDCPAPP